MIVKQAKAFEINGNSRKVQKLRKMEHTQKVLEMQVLEYCRKNVSVAETIEREENINRRDKEVELALKNLNNL